MFKSYEELYTSLMEDFKNILVNNYSKDNNIEYSELYYNYCKIYNNYSENELNLVNKSNNSERKFKEDFLNLFNKYNIRLGDISDKYESNNEDRYFDNYLNIMIDLSKIWNMNRGIEDGLISSELYGDYVIRGLKNNK